MNQYSDRQELEVLKLGRKTEYVSEYAPELLQAVPRELNRQSLSIVDEQPFFGVDVWQGYELSWLNSKGKPLVALGRFMFPASSPNIVESKSFKLYLNSLNQSNFESQAAFVTVLQRDLSRCCGADVLIELFAPDEIKAFAVTSLPGVCIDDLDIEVDHSALSADMLNVSNKGASASETLHSHLLKSNCLITNQPDWASIVIEYVGAKICRESLLRYLISFRLHNEFHEQCVERIFMDIYRACRPSRMSVNALYTRRGGLDISPFRTTERNYEPPRRRINRQ